MGTNPKVIILDEPTRGIDVAAYLANWPNMVMRIILISSDLPEILGLSDRVMVLYERSMKEFLEEEKIISQKIFSTVLKINFGVRRKLKGIL